MKTKALWLLTVILSLSGLSLSSCTDMADRTMDFCEQLRTTFAQRIERNAWMSSASKANVQEKAHIWQMKYSAEHAEAATMSDDPDEKDEHSLARERIHIW